MEVSESVKTAYRSNSVTKHVTLYFPELDVTIGTDRLYFESMHLSESILEKENIEFVGCIASQFNIQVHDLKEDVKGKKIIVKIHTDGTEDEPITLFNGIVDSAMKQSNKQIKEIVAYDELYTKGNVEVADWYKNLTFPITLKAVRDSLFSYIGMEQVAVELPNDNISISRQYEPNSLQALSVIKAICQINGAFGIVNRENKFAYRILSSNTYTLPYPSETLFPVFYPYSSGLKDPMNFEDFSFYKSIDYEEFEVKPVDKLTIRQSDSEAGVSYGDGTNTYIIQGNMFTYGLTDAELLTVAENVYDNVQGFAYVPFESDNNGLPYLECGVDAVSYMMIDYEATQASSEPIYEQRSFYILNREMDGIQNLRDEYSANGEEYQSEFITDLQTQIDTIKSSMPTNIESVLENYTYDKDTLNSMFENIGGLGDFRIMSVDSVPSSYLSDTLYLVQGEIFIQ